MCQSTQEIVNITNYAESSFQRVWEVDFLRGLLMMFVIWDHFMFNLWYFCQDSATALFGWLYSVSLDYYDSATTLGMLQETLHNGFVMAFVFVSGVSCRFSSNGLNRALRLLAVAFVLSAGTNALSQIVYRPLEINFNVIHVLAICCLLYCLVEKLAKRLTKKQIVALMVVLFVVAVVLGVVGYYFHSHPIVDGGVWVVFVNCDNSVTFSPADYLPLLPAMSFFIVGAIVGNRVYCNRRSIIGGKPKFANPLCWCGRKSLYIYILSQVVMFTFFYVFAHLLSVL